MRVNASVDWPQRDAAQDYEQGAVAISDNGTRRRCSGRAAPTAASNMTRSSFDYALLCCTIYTISARARQENYTSHTIALSNVISRPGALTAPWRGAFSAGKAPPSRREATARPGRWRRGLTRERRDPALAAGSPR